MWPGTATPIGMGCMRLSTERDRDAERAVAVLHAALDAGVTLLDTADAYCLDDTEIGHNERLIAHALATWSGDRGRTVIATKGGLIRPRGQWIADGRARHLREACEASLRALDLPRLPLYQLHAPDPHTPLATGVRALAALQRDGLVEAIGLCNVTVGQIEEARRLAEIAAVQIELSYWNDDGILGGVAAYCRDHGIRLLAFRPLGGAAGARRAAGDAALSEVARRHGATPQEIALAWARDLTSSIVPLPGPTQIETARSIGRSAAIALSDADRVVLDARSPSGGRLRRGERPASNAPPAQTGDIVLIMGLPGAGKSTVAQSFVERGYLRLNRDVAGGSLKALIPVLETALAGGATHIVLDNTYVSRKSRAAVLQAAAEKHLGVRCVWLQTSLEDAQVNAVSRMLSRYGKLLTPEELRERVKADVAAFGPGVQFRYQRDLEPPDAGEGFTDIEHRRFERREDASFTNRALIVWCDGVIYRSRSGRRAPAAPDDVEVVPGVTETLQRYANDGWRILGLSWQPDVAEGALTPEDVDRCFTRLRERLGVPIEIVFCPHGGGPPICWCRKPLPGLGVALIERHRLDRRQCVYVGAGPQDPGFARRLGFAYREAGEFFATASDND